MSINPTMRVSVYLDQWGAPLTGSVDIYRDGGLTETFTVGLEPDEKPTTAFRRLANRGLEMIHRDDSLARLFKV